MVPLVFLYFFFLLTLPSEQIIDGSINLDPDYQRGILVSYLVRQCRVAHSLRRCCLVRTKADRPHRLCLSQLLHSAHHLWSVDHFLPFCLKPLKFSQKLFQHRMMGVRAVFA